MEAESVVARFGPDPADRFYKLDEELLRDESLPPVQKLILIDLFHCERKRERVPAATVRAKRLVIDRDTLHRHERALIKLGYLLYQSRPGKPGVYFAVYPPIPADSGTRKAFEAAFQGAIDLADLPQNTAGNLPQNTAPTCRKIRHHLPQNTAGSHDDTLYAPKKSKEGERGACAREQLAAQLIETDSGELLIEAPTPMNGSGAHFFEHPNGNRTLQYDKAFVDAFGVSLPNWASTLLIGEVAFQRERGVEITQQMLEAAGRNIAEWRNIDRKNRRITDAVLKRALAEVLEAQRQPKPQPKAELVPVSPPDPAEAAARKALRDKNDALRAAGFTAGFASPEFKRVVDEIYSGNLEVAKAMCREWRRKNSNATPPLSDEGADR